MKSKKSVRRRQEDIKRVVEKLKARYSCLTAAEEFLLLFAMREDNFQRWRD